MKRAWKVLRWLVGFSALTPCWAETPVALGVDGNVGVYWSFSKDQLGVSSTLTILKAWGFLGAGGTAIFGTDYQAYGPALTVDIQGLAKKLGREVKYTSPVPLELSFAVARDFKAHVWDLGISLAILSF